MSPGQQEARNYPSRTRQRCGQDHEGVLLDLAETVRRRPPWTLRYRRPGRAGAGRCVPVAAGAEDHGRAAVPGRRPIVITFDEGSDPAACCGAASGFGPDGPNVPLPGRNGSAAASARSCCPHDQVGTVSTAMSLGSPRSRAAAASVRLTTPSRSAGAVNHFAIGAALGVSHENMPEQKHGAAAPDVERPARGQRVPLERADDLHAVDWTSASSTSGTVTATHLRPWYPTAAPRPRRRTRSVCISRLPARVPCHRTPGSMTRTAAAGQGLVAPRFLLIAGEHGQAWCEAA